MGLSQRKMTTLKAWCALGVFVTVVCLYINSKGEKNIFPYIRLGYSDKPRLPSKNISNAVLSHSCERNNSVENITGFSSFPDFTKDFLYYQHCRHFPMILDLPDKCGGTDHSSDVFLLLVIKSAPDNFDRREILRKTWAYEGQQNGVWIRRVFIIGTRGSGLEREKLNQIVDQEHSQYKDILQWDFADTFQNLTLKQVLFFEWVGRNCPKARFHLNGDDDVFINTNNAVKYLQSLKDNDGSKHLFMGECKSRIVGRKKSSKYFVPDQMYKPNYYPPYCNGGGFLLSGYTASVIYNMSQSIELHPIDDAYMGICLAKANLLPKTHIGMDMFRVHSTSKPVSDHEVCFYKELLVAHGFLPGGIYDLWQKVNDPNLKCFGNFK